MHQKVENQFITVLAEKIGDMQLKEDSGEVLLVTHLPKRLPHKGWFLLRKRAETLTDIFHYEFIAYLKSL